MRATNLYAPTLRNTPAEAEIASHQLMYRAGLIRKSAGGMYTYLPLAWRTIRKIEEIIRAEMEAVGGQEIMMPILQPSELWEESGRWGAYGAEMIRIKDRHDREFCMGPTHEEMITALVRDELRSYKQLPVLLYQIQDKFRDERRPRFGIMRSRELIMQDLYSFDEDIEGMNVSYRKMYAACSRLKASHVSPAVMHAAMRQVMKKQRCARSMRPQRQSFRSRKWRLPVRIRLRCLRNI